MLIRNQNGTLIIRAGYVVLDHYASTGKYALLVADGVNPELVIIGIYDNKAEAQLALDYIFTQAAEGRVADLMDQKRLASHQESSPACGNSRTPKWLDEALNAGDGVYRP